MVHSWHPLAVFTFVTSMLDCFSRRQLNGGTRTPRSKQARGESSAADSLFNMSGNPVKTLFPAAPWFQHSCTGGPAKRAHMLEAQACTVQ